MLTKIAARLRHLARKIGDLQGRLLLAVFYYVILGPFALLLRSTGDPLETAGPPAWRLRRDGSSDPGRQY